MDIIKQLEKELVEVKNFPNFKSGDTVTVSYKIKEGNTASDIFEERSFGKIETITEIDDNENYIEISISKKILAKDAISMPSNLNLGPPPNPPTKTIATAFNKFIQSYF